MNTSRYLDEISNDLSHTPTSRSQQKRNRRLGRRMLAKLCGGDFELANFFVGRSHSYYSTGYLASRALLAQIDGFPDEDAYLDEAASLTGDGKDENEEIDKRRGFYSQDWGRKWLSSNGGCVYVDLNHLELCLSEILSAYDHVASWHAMLRIARRALRRANSKLPPCEKIVILVNNSDGMGNSYGSHLNFALTRRAWNNMFTRRLHHLMFLASYQASSIIFTGQGKVGSENGRPEAEFQIASRADFFHELVGEQTTYSRPICNRRDEPLTGPRSSPYRNICRYHCIFYDNTLTHGSCLLKVGVMQMVLAALIEGERINPHLILEDPVHATMAYSHDPSLRSRMLTANGRKYTAVEHQLLFLEELRKPIEEGLLDEVVPEAKRILRLYEDTLHKLHTREFEGLRGRLDWVLKRYILEQAMSSDNGLSWDSPEIKHLDHLYSSLDPEEGLFWAYERAGVVEQHVSEDCIRRLTSEPPDDTRAWARAMLLRKANPGEVYCADWDSLTFEIRTRGTWSERVRVDLANPFGSTKAELGALIENSTTLRDALDRLGARTRDGSTSTLTDEQNCGLADLNNYAREEQSHGYEI